VDWAQAIAINQSALSRIVAALIAMVGLTVQDAVARLPRPVYRAALRILRPAESAVRRLIVMAARGVVAKPRAARPMPAGLTLPASGGAPATFQLFDARKRFAAIGPRSAGPGPEPRILAFGGSPLVPLFQPRVAADAEPARDDETVDATRFRRRLWAVKLALENLPRQVKRLKRWQARRARMANPKFRSSFRPGPPPGHRKAPKDDVENDVDRVLRECHALAQDALRQDSS
jgi:hypothetical protein